MREYFTYGSVRGAAGNGGPYRDNLFLDLLAKFVSVDLDWRHRCGWITVTNASTSDGGCCKRIR